MEISEPIDITIKDASSIEGAKPLEQKLKRVATEKQLNALQKARQQKAIKKKAIEMLEIQEEEETETNYSSYVLPILGIVGTVTSYFMLKKKMSSFTKNTSPDGNSSKKNMETSTNYSQLQLNF